MRNVTRLPGARPLHWLLLGCLFLLVLIGCGGGGGGSKSRKISRGNVSFTVAWPIDEPSRVIPTAAQSLHVQIKDGATILASQVIVKPATTTTFNDLPVGNLTVDVAAYENTSGTGTMLAYAAVPATITDGATTSVNVVLSSTIDHLEINPSTLTLGALRSQALTVTAKDANGNTVLTTPSSITFSSSAPGVVSVNSAGLVTAGGSLGTATITITEADSGKTTTLTVTVAPDVSVLPASASVNMNGTKQFNATVVGPVNTAVTWSVQEGATGGTISPTGLYTAPNHRGSYNVVATSVADTSRKTIIPVTVTAGSLNVGVQ